MRARGTVDGLESKPGNSRHASALAPTITVAVLAGSLIPDVIDKPLGALFYGGLFASGRTAGHTILFAFLVLLVGAGVWLGRRKLWGLAAFYGVALHYMMDEIWLKPSTFWWPLLGWGFADTQPAQMSDWFGGWLQELLYDPKCYVPEIIGFLAIVWFIYTYLASRSLKAKNGEPSSSAPHFRNSF